MTPVYRFSQAGSIATGRTHYKNMGVGVSSVAVPFAPTIGAATATDTASVEFTPSATGAAATSYTATSSPGGITGTSSSSPITVSGLTSGTAYTFTVTATNANGTSSASSASNSVTPVASVSYDSISTVTLGSTQSTISFSSIPQNYKHLQVRGIVRSTYVRAGGSQTGVAMYLRVGNNGTIYTSNYAWGELYGTGTSVLSFHAGTQTIMVTADQSIPSANSASQFYGPNVIDILDYTNTNKATTLRALSGLNQNGSGVTNVNLFSAAYFGTQAITDLQFTTDSDFAAGTTLSLYGIKGQFTMAAGNTYTPIATISAGGSSTVTFSSIPSTYTDLMLIIGGALSSQGYTDFTFNGNTASSYSYTRMLGYSGGLLSDVQTGAAGRDVFSVGTISGSVIAHILNYKNTTTYKTMMLRENNDASGVGLYTYSWLNTSAITSISIFPKSSATWITGSTLTLYGITAA